MLVKQVLNTETQTNVTEGCPHQNVAEICHKDPVLNSVIDCQAQVIHELLLCLDSISKTCSNFTRKVFYFSLSLFLMVVLGLFKFLFYVKNLNFVVDIFTVANDMYGSLVYLSQRYLSLY